jgi:hypothetical protein
MKLPEVAEGGSNPQNFLWFLWTYKQNSAGLDIVGETISPKKLNAKIEGSKRRVLNLPYWKSISKVIAPHSMKSMG